MDEHKETAHELRSRFYDLHRMAIARGRDISRARVGLVEGEHQCKRLEDGIQEVERWLAELDRMHDTVPRVAFLSHPILWLKNRRLRLALLAQRSTALERISERKGELAVLNGQIFVHKAKLRAFESERLPEDMLEESQSLLPIIDRLEAEAAEQRRNEHAVIIKKLSSQLDLMISDPVAFGMDARGEQMR